MPTRYARRCLLLLSLASAGFIVFTSSAVAGQGTADDCLACHSEPVEMTLVNGTTRAVRFQTGMLDASVHAGVRCGECHPGNVEIPHPDRQLTTVRQFTLAAAEQCRQCHFGEYRQSLESVHARAVARGDLTAPTCVDCHGGHEVARANQPRTRVAETCGRCHSKAATVYAASVHGEDVAKHIADVPTCTDCHGAHQVAGPGQAGWRTSTPDICGNCHGEAERMEKYGLSANVLRTYLSDFHGKTAHLRAAAGASQERDVVAVCSDCHGTHDVARAESPTSPVVKANLVNTCRRCHAEAGQQFPDAWLSHYEPSWRRTPVLMAVQTGYAVLIPFMIGGMMLQILLHVWRMAVNR